MTTARAKLIGAAAIAAVAAGVVVLTRDDDSPNSALAPACQKLGPRPDAELPKAVSPSSRGLGVRFPDSAGVLLEVRAAGSGGRVLGGEIRTLGPGAAVADLDGDGRNEPAVWLALPGVDSFSVTILFSRALLTVRADVRYTELERLELHPRKRGEQIDDLRRVGDCDGDDRAELLVQTYEHDCAGICTDSGSGVDRHRAYVISGRRARRPGREILGSDEAPRALTVEQPY